MMTSRKRSMLAALIAVPVLGVAITAFAQPADKPAEKQPGGDRPARAPRGDRPQSEGMKKYAEEMREHPQIARALASLTDARDHMKNAAHDFGGHKAEALKATDEAIKQLELALKSEPKQERKAPPGEGAPGGGGPGGGPGGGGGGRPGGNPPPAGK